MDCVEPRSADLRTCNQLILLKSKGLKKIFCVKGRKVVTGNVPFTRKGRPSGHNFSRFKRKGQFPDASKTLNTRKGRSSGRRKLVNARKGHIPGDTFPDIMRIDELPRATFCGISVKGSFPVAGNPSVRVKGCLGGGKNCLYRMMPSAWKICLCGRGVMPRTCLKGLFVPCVVRHSVFRSPGSYLIYE